MSWRRRLAYLWPPYRRAVEEEMREELAGLEGEVGRTACSAAAENAREVWGWTWLDSIGKDLRFAFRVLARDRSFTAVAVISLGLGIGANAAIFSLIDTLLLRQLPVQDPERLVNFDDNSYSWPTFQEFRNQSKESLSGVLATSAAQARDFDAGGGLERRLVECVSAEYFEVLGVRAALGRTITPEDTEATPVVVISHDYWQRSLGGDPAAIGRTLRIQKVPFLIVGVAPAEFFGVRVGQAADAWAPLATFPRLFPGAPPMDSTHHIFLDLLGRLRPGVTSERASAALTPLAVQLALGNLPAGIPASVRQEVANSKLKLVPAGKGLSALRTRFSKPLRAVFAMVGIGLLLACVNVMSLQFARADARRRELSVRLAIGAGRGRIVRQLLIESLVVALAGGAMGLAIRRPAAAALTSILSGGGGAVQLDLEMRSGILLFVLGISVAAALLCGIVPAVRATRGELLPGLQQGSRAMTASPLRRAVGRSVAAVQLALSVILIAAAFLFAFSLQKLLQVDTGLDRRNLLVVPVDAGETGYDGAQMAALNHRLAERMASRPGVASVSFSAFGIYSTADGNSLIDVDGFQSANRRDHMAFLDQVGPDYFTTLGSRPVAGRDFSQRDDATREKVAIVNQEFARHFFGDRNPLGLNLYRDAGHGKEIYRIVGIARDIRTDVRKRPRLRYYLARLQTVENWGLATRFLVRTNGNRSNLAADLRAAVRAEDPALRVDVIATGDQLLERTLDLDRLIAALASAFGVLAVVLAAVGIYGLMAYDTARRTGEIGIRMALGATRGSVMALVFREVLLVGGLGMVAGTAASLALGRLLAGLVFELKPSDPRVLGSAAVVLMLVAAAAAWFPARRAARMNPISALRVE